MSRKGRTQRNRVQVSAEAWQPVGAVWVSVWVCLTLGSLRAHHQVSHPPGGQVVEPAGLRRRGLGEASEWISRTRFLGAQRLSEGPGLAWQLIRMYPGSMRGLKLTLKLAVWMQLSVSVTYAGRVSTLNLCVFIAMWGL